MKSNLLSYTLVALLVSACVMPYQPEPKERTANINIESVDSATICIAGKHYGIGIGRKGKLAPIPAERALTIYTKKVVGNTAAGNYSVTYTCSPRLGIQLEQGKTYFLNLEQVQDRCRLEVYEENKDSHIGLIPVMPLKAENCGQP